jgi:hypothetical protein
MANKASRKAHEKGGSQAKRSARTDLGKPLTITAARPLGTWMLENVPGRMEGVGHE